MFSLEAYGIGLAVITVAATLTAIRWHRGQLFRSILAVALNWALGIAFNYWTGITDGWWFNICIDVGAATMILYHPAGRWQAVLGVSYCFQLLMHVGYGAHFVFDGGGDAMAYYRWLTGIAWAQLLILGGWCGGIWIGGTRRRAVRSATTVGAVVKRVEEAE